MNFEPFRPLQLPTANFIYSDLKLFAGLAIAAFITSLLIIINVIIRIHTIGIKNIHQHSWAW